MLRGLELIFFCLLAVFAAGCSQSEEDRVVSELIEKATGLVVAAEASQEAESLKSDALERQALARLEEAVTLYPASPLTHELSEGKILVGPYTFAELKERIAERDRIEAAVKNEKEEDIFVIGEDPLSVVLKLTKEEGPAYFKAGMLGRIAVVYEERGESDRAAEFFSRALETARSVGRPYFKILALTEVAAHYLAAEEEERALSILDAARASVGDIQYPYFRSGALRVIADRYAFAGRYEAASRIIETIDDPYFRARALVDLADRYSANGQAEMSLKFLNRALPAADEIEDLHFQAEALAEIAGGLAVVGEEDRPPELFDRALGIADSITDPSSQARALAGIGGGYAKAGEMENAAALLSRGAESAAAIKNNLFKDLVLREIVELSAGIEEYDQAARIANDIKEPRFRALALAEISERYGSAGKKEDAAAFATRALVDTKKIRNPHFKAEVLLKIADLLIITQPTPPPVVTEASPSPPGSQ